MTFCFILDNFLLQKAQYGLFRHFFLTVTFLIKYITNAELNEVGGLINLLSSYISNIHN